MDVIEAIMSRRSIRRYTDRAIEDDTIEMLLKAAMQAPSAHNSQSWQLVVITERALLDVIPRFHRYAGMLRQAPAAILVCGDSRLEENVGYCILNCAAATQNILLAAHALDLGAVWLGIYPRERRIEEIRRLLDLPPEIIPMNLVSLGYPAEHKPPEERYRPQRVHRNRWQERP